MKDKRFYVLYSINGEGRYTSEEVRRILNRPKLNLTNAVDTNQHGIKVVARRKIRAIKCGKPIGWAWSCQQMAEALGYEASAIVKRLNHPENYKNKDLVIEEYWENENETD